MLAILFAVLLSAPAHTDKGFAPIPADQTGGKSTGLELRVLEYSGSVNGTIEVELRNPTAQAVDFSAKGMYFVPDGNPDQAPQRLGAVGPFLVKEGKSWKRAQKYSLAADTTVQVKLDVYCIDSQRGSPSSGTSFHVARSRIPARVIEAIDASAAEAAAPLGGVSAPAAKSAVQSEVWRHRDEKWVPLDGEGKQEAGK